jgi:uncharacterized membrane protein YjjP (DUF1212 family)
MRAVRMSLSDALKALLRFATLMLRAGDTAFRVREAVDLLANNMGIERLDVQFDLNSMVATARRGDKQVTLAVEVAPIGINAWRISALDTLARSSRAGLTPARLMADLDAIEAAPVLRSTFAVALAVGLASGAFSYLNGGDALSTAAAAVAGGLGQALRALMFRHRRNQYATTALCAVFTSGLYCLIIAATGSGFTSSHAAGFIFCVLFLVPGFPLVAALLDLVQHHTVVGMARLSYAVMVLLSAGIGLSAVAALAHLTVQPASPLTHTIDALMLGLRALASLLGGCGFAVLYNSSTRTVLAVGVMSLLGNDLRLALHDAGMALPPATFFGALLVGLIASVTQARLHEPRIALTVPSIIIMTPGLFAFQTIVLLNEGQTLIALQAAAECFFIVGGMALGLAAARFATEWQWTAER